MTRKVAILFGGLRGLSKAIGDTYHRQGYECIYMTRSLAKDDHFDTILLDLDNPDVISRSYSELFSRINIDVQELSIHFLTGGSLKPDINEVSRVALDRVIYHNFLFPYSTIMQMFISENTKVTPASSHISIYLTGASLNLRAHPLYIASKDALESFMRFRVCQNIPNLTFSAFRLGMVDVEYKYFSKLKSEYPSQFEGLLRKSSPALKFATTEEIAKFVFNANANKSLANGMIADITGGNSWI